MPSINLTVEKSPILPCDTLPVNWALLQTLLVISMVAIYQKKQPRCHCSAGVQCCTVQVCSAAFKLSWAPSSLFLYYLIFLPLSLSHAPLPLSLSSSVFKPLPSHLIHSSLSCQKSFIHFSSKVSFCFFFLNDCIVIHFHDV